VRDQRKPGQRCDSIVERRRRATPDQALGGIWTSPDALIIATFRPQAAPLLRSAPIRDFTEWAFCAIAPGRSVGQVLVAARVLRFE
jgi:hypothetical protein